MSRGFCVMVEGSAACFTIPEFKVERMSYDVPTPSALEGMLKSIYWKPAIRYVIDEIVVLNPIKHDNIRRNEISTVIKLSDIKSQMKDSDYDLSVYSADSKNRTQRSTIFLKDVKYAVRFHFELTGIKNEKDDECEEKHYNIILRRLKNGQNFKHPCLGCSEFPVKSIELIPEIDKSLISQEIIDMGDVDLGNMVYAVKFEDNGIPLNNNWENPVFSNKAKTVYYHPHMVNGVIDVQKYREGITC